MATRARTGTIEPFKRADGSVYYRARVRLADGTRERADIPDSLCHDKRRAKGYAEALQEREDAHGTLLAEKRRREARKRTRVMPTAEMKTWIETWADDRRAKGYTSVGENLSHYENHIAPAIGTKHVRDWMIDDVRGLSRALDDKVQHGHIAWKTARNVWTTAGKMLADATKSKRDDIRCRIDDAGLTVANPIRDVEGPDRGVDRARQYLYPSEVLAFVSCPEVSLLWRAAVALAVYVGARAGELRVLRWEDVDLDRGKIHIHRARDRVTGDEKPTKGKLARRFAIEPHIVPLLSALHDASGGEGLVLDMPSERDLARGLKRWLRRAGVKRAELFVTDATRQAIRFHDLRSSFCTWMAVRGDDPLKIKQRAGHRSFSTTEGYIRTAEELREGFGEVFPALPLFWAADGNPSATSLGGLAQVAGQVARSGRRASRNQQKQGVFWRGGRDSNPRPPA
jgi:integrase